MTKMPSHTEKKLGLVIDLDTCVGCHGCVNRVKRTVVLVGGLTLLSQLVFTLSRHGSQSTGHAFDFVPKRLTPNNSVSTSGAGGCGSMACRYPQTGMSVPSVWRLATRKHEKPRKMS